MNENPHLDVALLVCRAQQGDRSAFGELFRRYRERIFALVLHLCGNQDEAEDITQEVFLGAFRAIHQFAGRSQFFTWVYRIAVNRALNAARDRRRRGETPLDDPRLTRALEADANNDPRRAAELRSTYTRLLYALDRLPVEMRTSVVLVALQGMNHEEAAIIQGCSPGTVSWRMHEARKRLYKALVSAPQPLRPTATGWAGITARPLSSELHALLAEWGLPVLART